MAARGGAGAGGAGALVGGISQEVFDGRIRHFISKPSPQLLITINIQGYPNFTYYVYDVDIEGFLGKQIILIYDNVNKTYIAYFTFNFAEINGIRKFEPWIELYDFQKNPQLGKHIDAIPIMCTFLDYYKSQINTKCHIWAGSYIDKLIDKYVANGFSIIYKRDGSFISPLGVQILPEPAPAHVAGAGAGADELAPPQLPRQFTSLIYKPNAPLSLYKMQKVPVAAYTHPIRFSFRLPTGILRDALHANILADGQPERGFVFFSHNKMAKSPPDIVWKGTHFELTEELSSREIDSSKAINIGGGKCRITGCVPAPINPGLYIIGHTHPKSMYVSYSVHINTPILLGPPSSGDVNINIVYGCPVQCVFTVEGVYVLETLQVCPDGQKAKYIDFSNQYQQYIMNDIYGAMRDEFQRLHGIAITAIAHGHDPVEIHNGFKDAINNMKRRLIRAILEHFNDLFKNLIQMRFHLWSGEFDGSLIPSNITIRSLINPLQTLEYKDSGGATFPEVDPRIKSALSIDVDKATLESKMKFVNDLQIFRPLDYLNDESDSRKRLALLFSNALGNRTAEDGALEQSNESAAVAYIRRAGEEAGKRLMEAAAAAHAARRAAALAAAGGGGGGGGMPMAEDALGGNLLYNKGGARQRKTKTLPYVNGSRSTSRRRRSRRSTRTKKHKHN